MNNVGILFEIYRAEEISKEARIRLIKKMGTAINDTLAMNATEEIVVELVLLLDPKNDIVRDEHYRKYFYKDQRQKNG